MKQASQWAPGALLALTLLLAGCVAPQGPAGQGQSEDGPPTTSRRFVVAIGGAPPTLSDWVNTGTAGNTRPIPPMLFNVGLTVEDVSGTLRGVLAETAPTVENGNWKILPDGRMETTWKIRNSAKWHDGTPFTAEDIAFTAALEQDKEMPLAANRAYTYIESVEAPDPSTVLIKWKQPYIQADAVFGPGTPKPRHLLEDPYRRDKTTFLGLPYWTDQFVGTGPFKLKEWGPGTHAAFTAFDAYVLGRPKLDEMEVRFFQDANALMANILGGDVELTTGTGGLSLEQGVQVRDLWTSGRMESVLNGWIAIYPQFIDPNPPAILDVQFRRALLHAIDRQLLVDTILGQGVSSVAHTFVSTQLAEYRDVETSVVKYDYDPRRSAQLLEELGYTRGPSGLFRDRAVQDLKVELRSVGTTVNAEKSLLPIADDWRKAGVSTDAVPIPPQLTRDAEYRNARPGFEILRQPNDSPSVIPRLASKEIATSQNGFRGENKTRYANPELDQLVDRYQVTIPLRERNQIVAQVVRHVSEQSVIMGLLYKAGVTMISNRLVDVAAGGADGWNAHEWNVR